MINKANDGHFGPNDETVFEKYLQFCGIGLRNAQLYERSQLEVCLSSLELYSNILDELIMLQPNGI